VQHGEVDVVPANIDLAGAEVTLLSRTGREYLLRGELADLLDSYDAVLIDCAPSLGVLTINGLTAADQVVIPVQCETLAHRGVSQLLDTIGDVRRLTNRSLKVRGLVATMFDPRTRHSREVLRDLLARYDLPAHRRAGPQVGPFRRGPDERDLAAQRRHRRARRAAYRVIARELLDLEVEQELLDEAGWDDARRDDVLGLDVTTESDGG
jgi:chromosome partitioning protein